MKTISDVFRESIEYDIHSNPEAFKVLQEYTLCSLAYDSRNLKVFNLENHQDDYTLEVHRKSSPSSQFIHTWETDLYTYFLKKK